MNKTFDIQLTHLTMRLIVLTMVNQFILLVGTNMHRYDFETEHLIEDFIYDEEEEQLPLHTRIYNYIYPNGYEVYHLVTDAFIIIVLALLFV